jgi:FkbH-like protein
LGLSDFVRAAAPRCDVDYILVNHLSELPGSPPQAVREYDFQFVQIPLRSVLPEQLYFRASYADLAAWERIFDEARERLCQFLDGTMRWNAEHGLLTFVSNFMLPQQNLHGRLQPRYDLRNPVYFVERLNEALHEELRRYSNVHVLDIDQIAASFGRKYIQDDAVWVLNHGAVLGDYDFQHDQSRIAPISPLSDYYTLRGGEFAQSMWAELMGLYRTVLQIDPVKLVVVDLDDTLWRGVAAEGDLPHVALEGWPLGLIESLGYLKRRGVLLAIASRNEESRVVGFWDNIMGGRLSLDDFAARRINWNPKAENVEAIIREVNVLPRSVVFVDDNPVERAAVQSHLPDVRVIGANQYHLRRILLWAPETQVPVVTEESARKTELIQANGQRESARKRLSRSEFLASLALKLRLAEIRDVGAKQFPRAFELLNKTNQFNTTGKRWRREDCHAAFGGGAVMYSFEVEDRFSNYGLVGVVISAGRYIEQMVMSCRVVGLDVEIAALTEILRRMRMHVPTDITANLIETDANIVCRDLFQRCNFKSDHRGCWVIAPEIALKVPRHITLG